jgi:hypothetical protein
MTTIKCKQKKVFNSYVAAALQLTCAHIKTLSGERSAYEDFDFKAEINVKRHV